MSDKAVRKALARVFSLDSNPGVVIVRARPEHLADEVLRELAAMGYEVRPIRRSEHCTCLQTSMGNIASTIPCPQHPSVYA